MKKILFALIYLFVGINVLLAQQYDPVTQIRWQNVGIFYTSSYIKLPGGGISTSGGISEAYSACVAASFTSCDIEWSGDFTISSPIDLALTTALYMNGNGHTAHCTNSGVTYCFTVDGVNAVTSPPLQLTGLTFNGSGATGSGVSLENFGEWQGDGTPQGTSMMPYVQITVTGFSNVLNSAQGLQLISFNNAMVLANILENYNGLSLVANSSGGESGDIITAFISDGGDLAFSDKNGIALNLNGAGNGIGNIRFHGGLINGNFGTSPIQINAGTSRIHSIIFDSMEIEFNGDATSASRIITLNPGASCAGALCVFDIKFVNDYIVGGGGLTGGSLGYLFTAPNTPQKIANISFDNSFISLGTFAGSADSTLTGYILGSVYSSDIKMADFNTFFPLIVPAPTIYKYVSRATTTTISPQTLTTPSITSTYLFSFSINCDTAVSGATIQGNVTFTDPSGTIQTRQTGVATCTTLGAASYSGDIFSQSILAGTVITASSTISGSPNYDYVVTAQQVTAN